VTPSPLDDAIARIHQRDLSMSRMCASRRRLGIVILIGAILQSRTFDSIPMSLRSSTMRGAH